METIAVYWEDRIKTYGFSETTGLSFLQWTSSPEELSGLGAGVEELEGSGSGMVLVLGQAFGGHAVSFGLLVEQRREGRVARRLQGVLSGVSRSPAGLIHFYGPHFGDRYGIAAAGLRMLNDRGVPIMAIACSASSIYLVLPEEHVEAAKIALAEVFVRPEG